MPAPQWVHGLLVDRRSLFMEAVRKANKELSMLATGKASSRVPYVLSCKAFMKSTWKLFGTVSSIMGENEWDTVELLDVFVESLRTVLNSTVRDFGTLVSACRCVELFSGISSVIKQIRT